MFRNYLPRLFPNPIIPTIGARATVSWLTSFASISDKRLPASPTPGSSVQWQPSAKLFGKYFLYKAVLIGLIPGKPRQGQEALLTNADVLTLLMLYAF
uniref:ATP synthase subunit f, mitochondrial n=1 Tax=Steinernema glaseri TaxID=37863 RepID=A0A1I7ZT85_9BILA